MPGVQPEEPASSGVSSASGTAVSVATATLPLAGGFIDRRAYEAAIIHRTPAPQKLFKEYNSLVGSLRHVGCRIAIYAHKHHRSPCSRLPRGGNDPTRISIRKRREL